ncbi:MAG: amino acid ABC transporter substrate-binding protein, partial [PS1 clade bacterium]|nr:amino acid ABC transporter substrate-binding protein [PS1 clade bacterium]
MQIKRKGFIAVVSLVLGFMPLLAGVYAQAAGSTLEVVKQRGHLQCGVSQGLPGFSNPDDKGNWTG